MSIAQLTLESLRYRFRGIKKTGDGLLAQVDDDDLNRQINPEVNSIGMIVQHLHGNMLSRWTDFLTTDGDKPWRDREGEFEPSVQDKESVLLLWEEGWACTLASIDALTEEDLTRVITIRGQELGVIDACLRQISHYGYHVGQMVHIGKERLGDRWQTLSIAKGKSGDYKPGKKD